MSPNVNVSTASASASTPIWYKPLMILLLVLSLVLVVLSGRFLLAGIKDVQVQLFLDHWQRRGSVPSEQAWKVAHEAAESAVKWSPAADGNAFAQLGRVNEWYRIDTPFGSEDSNTTRLAALDAYRAQTEIRPLWPYGWTQLAFIKLRLLQFDEEFHQALINARQHGGSRARIHAQLAEISFIAWPQLSETERQAAWHSMEAALRYVPRYSKSLTALGDNAGLTPQLCSHVDPAVLQQRRLCR